MVMHIRSAGTDERERLLDLWERSVRATHSFLEHPDVLALRPLVAQALAGDAVQWWVLASDDDVPIGFLGYTPDTIEALFLDPDHRGRGGGTLLVAHAQTLSGRALAVDVNEQNPAARGFYEALGFAVAGRSGLDSGGRPFPILHLKRPAPD